MRTSTPIFLKFLNRRNKQMLILREKGVSLKEIADKFKLSVRQISRIIKEMS